MSHDAKLNNEGDLIKNAPEPLSDSNFADPLDVTVAPGNGQGGKEGNPVAMPDGNPGGRQGAKHP